MNGGHRSLCESGRSDADQGTRWNFLWADLIGQPPTHPIHGPVKRHELYRAEGHDTSFSTPF
jgi:hypothetical protein